MNECALIWLLEQFVSVLELLIHNDEGSDDIVSVLFIPLAGTVRVLVTQIFYLICKTNKKNLKYDTVKCFIYVCT